MHASEDTCLYFDSHSNNQEKYRIYLYRRCQYNGDLRTKSSMLNFLLCARLQITLIATSANTWSHIHFSHSSTPPNLRLISDLANHPKKIMIIQLILLPIETPRRKYILVNQTRTTGQYISTTSHPSPSSPKQPMRTIALNPPLSSPEQKSISNKIHLRITLRYMIVGRSDIDTVTGSFDFWGGAVMVLELVTLPTQDASWIL